MLINKTHLLKVGVEPTLAARFIAMLYRLAPSTTVELPRGISQKGALPTRAFDLHYALGIARTMEVSPHPKVNNAEWESLRSALEKVTIHCAVQYALRHPTISIHSIAIDFKIEPEVLHEAYRMARVSVC